MAPATQHSGTLCLTMPHHFPKIKGDKEIKECQKWLYQLATLCQVFIKTVESGASSLKLCLIKRFLNIPKEKIVSNALPFVSVVQ